MTEGGVSLKCQTLLHSDRLRNTQILGSHVFLPDQSFSEEVKMIKTGLTMSLSFLIREYNAFSFI